MISSRLLRFAPVIAVASLGFRLACAQSTEFVPAAYGATSVGANGIVGSLWTFTYGVQDIIESVPVGPSSYLYKSNLFSLDVAAKLGISNVALKASAQFSSLCTEECWSKTVQVKLAAYKGDTVIPDSVTTAVAVVGRGVLSTALVKGGSLDVAVTSGSLGVDANLNIYSETVNISASGYEEFCPFTLPLNTNGTVKFDELRKAVNQLFDDYQDKNKAVKSELILGFLVPRSLYIDEHGKTRDFDSIHVEKP